MSKPLQPSAENRLRAVLDPEASSPERALKNLRYVIGAVNDDARKIWNEVWQELQLAAGSGGMVSLELKEGFQPSCGWPEFLEKLWLLKHYLDWIHRFCK